MAKAREGFAVQATPKAVATIGGLRGKARKSYDAFLSELRRGGCTVAGYRLLAGDPADYSDYCCKALVENWRVLSTFEPGVAVIAAVGRHDDQGFYAELAKTLEIGAIGQSRKHKPNCCGEDGWPNVGDVRGKRRKPRSKS